MPNTGASNQEFIRSREDLIEFQDFVAKSSKNNTIVTGLGAMKKAGIPHELAAHLTLAGSWLDNAMFILRAGNLPDANSVTAAKSTNEHSKTATTGIGRGFIPVNPMFSKPKSKDTTEAMGLYHDDLKELTNRTRETIQLKRTLYDLLKLALDPDGDIELVGYNSAKNLLIFKYQKNKSPIYADEIFDGEFIIKLNEGQEIQKYFARPWDCPSEEIKAQHLEYLKRFINNQHSGIVKIILGGIHSPQEYSIYYKGFNETLYQPFEVFAKEGKPITGDWDMFAQTMPIILAPIEIPSNHNVLRFTNSIRKKFKKIIRKKKILIDYHKVMNADPSGFTTLEEKSELVNAMADLFKTLKKHAKKNTGLFNQQTPTTERNLLKEFLLDKNVKWDKLYDHNFFKTAGLVTPYEGLWILITNYIYDPKNKNKYFGERKKTALIDAAPRTSTGIQYLDALALGNCLNPLQHGPECNNPHAGNTAISSGSAGPYLVIYNGMQLYIPSEEKLIELCLTDYLLKKQFLPVHFANPMEKWHPIIDKQLEFGQGYLIDPRTLDAYNKYKYLAATMKHAATIAANQSESNVPEDHDKLWGKRRISVPPVDVSTSSKSARNDSIITDESGLVIDFRRRSTLRGTNKIVPGKKT